jgi:hypothetical protein
MFENEWRKVTTDITNKIDRKTISSEIFKNIINVFQGCIS